MQGDACILLYADFVIITTPELIESGVLELGIRDEGRPKALRCLMEFGAVGKIDTFNCLFNLPYLLRACLQSNNIVERQMGNDREIVKVYNVRGVVVRGNYKHFRKHPHLGFMDNLPYDALPYFFKETIEKECIQYNSGKKLFKNF